MGLCTVSAAAFWFECIHETIVVCNWHSLMMCHSGPKHVGVDVLQYFCNINEVYAFVDLLSNSYFGILSMFTWTQLLQCELGEGEVPPHRCQIGIFRGPNKWRYEEEMVGHVALRCFNERNKKRFLIFGIPRQRMSKWIASRSNFFLQ